MTPVKNPIDEDVDVENVYSGGKLNGLVFIRQKSDKKVQIALMKVLLVVNSVFKAHKSRATLEDKTYTKNRLL